MKCVNCGSEQIIKGKLCDWHTISFYKIKSNGKGSFTGIPTRCDICVDCGTVIRIYVEKESISKLKDKI